MRTERDILNLYYERKQRLDPLRQQALTIRDAYYGNIVLAVPEQDRADKPLVANLLYQGGEQRAMRVASTMPNVYFPSKKPGQDLADNRSGLRRQVVQYWWDEDLMKIKLRKRARHLVYYASTPVLLRPDMKRACPTWQVRNPLHTLPPEMDVADLVPPDCIFVNMRSGSWIQSYYPDAYSRLNKKQTGDETYMTLEYVDSDIFWLLVVGEKHINDQRYGHQPTTSPDGEIVTLEKIPNRLGRCPAVIPSRIGLEDPRGEFDGMVGIWQAQAKLLSLLTYGTQMAVFPEKWLVDRPGEVATVTTEADPMRGQTGHVSGGSLEVIHPGPEVFASNLVNYLERYARIDAGIPAELGGESTSNIRTGRRGDSVLSAVLDFPIQEEQQLLEAALREENKIAIAIDKEYFPRSKTYILATGGEVTYEPGKLFDSDIHFVRYTRAGVDAQALTVEIGQRVGMGTLSQRSAMEIDPLVDDPQSEFDRIMVERTRAGLQQSLIAMAANPEMAPVVAQIIKSVKAGETEIEDAVIAVDAAIKQQQAAAQQAAQGQPGALAPPGSEQQPGMGAPAIGAPSPSLENMTALLSAIHGGFRNGAQPAPQVQRTG